MKENDSNVRREFGHNVQMMILGFWSHLLKIGIPSATEASRRDYCDRPWEITAEYLGGVTREYDAQDLKRGWLYMAAAFAIGPYAFLFLLGEN